MKFIADFGIEQQLSLIFPNILRELWYIGNQFNATPIVYSLSIEQGVSTEGTPAI